jgi:hypothetical protein
MFLYVIFPLFIPLTRTSRNQKGLNHGGTKTQRKDLKKLGVSVSPWLAKISGSAGICGFEENEA